MDLWNVNQDVEALAVRCEIPNHQKLALNPVMSMQQVGTQNPTNLIAASNDGASASGVCIASQPQEHIDLKHFATTSPRSGLLGCLGLQGGEGVRTVGRLHPRQAGE